MTPVAAELFAGPVEELRAFAQRGVLPDRAQTYIPMFSRARVERGGGLGVRWVRVPAAAGAWDGLRAGGARVSAVMPYAAFPAGIGGSAIGDEDAPIIAEIGSLLSAIAPPACALVLVYPDPVSPCAFYPRRCRFDADMNRLGYPGRWSHLHVAEEGPTRGIERLVRLCCRER